ncbi:unnamed protein product, partial [Ectocarpus sp. 12 AP-2014]
TGFSTSLIRLCTLDSPAQRAITCDRGEEAGAPGIGKWSQLTRQHTVRIDRKS